MKKTMCFALALAFPICAHAVELNGIGAAEVKTMTAPAFTAPSAVTASPAELKAPVLDWSVAAKAAYIRELEAGGLTTYADLLELPPGARSQLEKELQTLPQGPGNTSEAFKMLVNGRTAFVVQSYIYDDNLRVYIFNAAGVPVAYGEGSVDKDFAWLPIPAAKSIPSRNIHPAPGSLPENCGNMPVMYTKDGDLYRNGQKLGSNVSSYKGACSGDVAWRNSYGDLYKNTDKLGGSSQNFEIALYTGDVFWTDNYGRLHKNSSGIGDAQTFQVADHTGDVAWRDNYGRLYKNGEELGSSSRYQIAGYTGDVVWVDGYGTLYKNQEKLGDSSRFSVAERTGDVAWMDPYSRLYMNKTQISSNCQSFELREDGKLLWRDSYGDYHYQ